MSQLSASATVMAPNPDVPIMFEAIVRQLCISATYNRVEMTLAPHVIYMRHGDLFIDAVAVEREGKPPREEKIGTFKLAGLNDVRLTTREFRQSTLYSASDEKYADALMTVEAG